MNGAHSLCVCGMCVVHMEYLWYGVYVWSMYGICGRMCVVFGYTHTHIYSMVCGCMYIECIVCLW